MDTAGAGSEETTGSCALPVTPTRTKGLLRAYSRLSPGALGDAFLLTINPARMGYRMLGLDTVESVAHVIQVALTPVFLLSGIASLLGVLSTRLARVADRVDALAEQLETDGPIDRRKLRRRLAYLRRRSHVLDAAVMMGTLGGVATSCAALLLFVGTLRDRPGVSLFVAFGLALLFTMGALVAFLIEMLLASRGLRDQADDANQVEEMHELAAEGVGEPTRDESG
jgi:cytochrome c biogenesis protein CcdA